VGNVLLLDSNAFGACEGVIIFSCKKAFSDIILLLVLVTTTLEANTLLWQPLAKVVNNTLSSLILQKVLQKLQDNSTKSL